MSKRHPSRALKLLNDRQLQRILRDKDEIVVGSPNYCPLAVALQRQVVSGAELMYGIDSHEYPEQKVAIKAGREFVSWFDSTAGHRVYEKRKIGIVVGMVRRILRQRGVTSV